MGCLDASCVSLISATGASFSAFRCRRREVESKTFFGGENWKIGKLKCAQLLFSYKIQTTKYKIYLPSELSIQSSSLTASVHLLQKFSRSESICSKCALPQKLSKPLPSSHSIQRAPYVNFVQNIEEDTTIAACWSHNSHDALSPFARCSGRCPKLFACQSSSTTLPSPATSSPPSFYQISQALPTALRLPS